jgi:hypothetical protein
MKPRYVVSSVTGYPIIESGATSGVAPKSIWSVLDSAFCFEPVTTVRHHYSYGERGEREARRLAAELNALDLLGPPPPPALCAGNGR